MKQFADFGADVVKIESPPGVDPNDGMGGPREENEKDLVEIPIEITRDLKILPVRWIDKVLELALERKPVPLVDAEVSVTGSEVVAKSETKKDEKPIVTKH